MNILFVMKHPVNAGNIHACATYARVGQSHGHTIALYGAPRSWLPNLRFSADVQAFDRVVYLFESDLYRVSRLQEVTLVGTVPRRHRLIFDSDGMYNPRLVIDGYDSNHRDEADRARWISLYEALADQVAQPTLAPSVHPGVTPLAFYGYAPALQVDPDSAPPKQYDILHVGHNWWRWREVAEELLPAFRQIRDRVGEIAFVGLWWDSPPVEGSDAGPEEAFRSDPEAFRQGRIRIVPAVGYSDVIRTMSSGRVNILTQRPLLRRLKHLTLKYFEVLCADTIPLLMVDGDLAEAVYGPAGRELTLPGRVAGKLLDALQRPDHYRDIVAEIRRHLVAHHSYDRRVEELVTLLRTGPAEPGQSKGVA